jgi:hypothetical protein
MKDHSGALESHNWTATEYSFEGSGVDSDCKKTRPIPSRRYSRVRRNIICEALPAIVKTLIFTVVVHGAVAGYLPWRFRQDAAAPVTGADLRPALLTSLPSATLNSFPFACLLTLWGET